jgi:hypothetical protein
MRLSCKKELNSGSNTLRSKAFETRATLADESWGLLSARPKSHSESVTTRISNINIKHLFEREFTNPGNLNNGFASVVDTNTVRGIWPAIFQVAKPWSQHDRSFPALDAHVVEHLHATMVSLEVEVEVALPLGIAPHCVLPQRVHAESCSFD